jgi:hypothetical protein
MVKWDKSFITMDNVDKITPSSFFVDKYLPHNQPLNQGETIHRFRRVPNRKKAAVGQ